MTNCHHGADRASSAPVLTPAFAVTAPADHAHTDTPPDAPIDSASDLRSWIGRTVQRDDLVTAAPLAGLLATLDRADDPAPVPGSALPPLSHWLYFLPQALQRDLGVDGHPLLGGFLPPIQLPRRMWAGGRLCFEQPLRIGDTATRRSTITHIAEKAGRSGPLVFVTVAHEISTARGLCVREEHDIVYRAPAQPGATPPTPALARTDEHFSRTVTPDPVLLFRYSALTFNAHRIHYDRDHATQVEGYPGLVVHGPLIATLLLDLLRRELPDATVAQFEFTAASPLFDLHPITLCGQREADGSAALWARNPRGHLAMTARAVLA
ncbi:MAG: MaoC family dehydratase N-terminal domain-containing protein [Burkholderiaceae bacterium]|nr:MaoC family dehydratase N-terminal domain-containing protein [Burkholderiaceae bacterium]